MEITTLIIAGLLLVLLALLIEHRLPGLFGRLWNSTLSTNHLFRTLFGIALTLSIIFLPKAWLIALGLKSLLVITSMSKAIVIPIACFVGLILFKVIGEVLQFVGRYLLDVVIGGVSLILPGAMIKAGENSDNLFLAEMIRPLGYILNIVLFPVHIAGKIVSVVGKLLNFVGECLTGFRKLSWEEDSEATGKNLKSYPPENEDPPLIGSYRARQELYDQKQRILYGKDSFIRSSRAVAINVWGTWGTLFGEEEDSGSDHVGSQKANIPRSRDERASVRL